MPSHAAAAKAVLHYLDTDVAPGSPAALAESLHRFLERTGGATATPRITASGAVEIHCGPILMTLHRVIGPGIVPAQAAFWGRITRPTRIEKDTRVGLQLSVSVAVSDTGEPTEDLATPLLAGAACELARAARPSALQWLKPTSWTTGAQFLDVLDSDRQDPVTLDPAGPVAPRRMNLMQRKRTARPAPAFELTGVGHGGAPRDTADALLQRTAKARAALTAPIEINVEAEAATASTSERLAAWSVSLSLAAFSLPVATSLAVYNLLRGEDLRHTSHVAALTGFMLTLGSTGAFAQVASVLGV